LDDLLKIAQQSAKDSNKMMLVMNDLLPSMLLTRRVYRKEDICSLLDIILQAMKWLILSEDVQMDGWYMQ
jgi:hypothetical protein